MNGWIRIAGLVPLILLLSCQRNQQMNDQHSNKSTEKNVEAASYNTQLGLAYLKQGNRPRAKRKLLTALSLDKTSPDVNAAIAYYFEKTQDKVEADAYYQKALAYSKNSGAQLNNYGAFLCRLGQYVNAEQYFLKAVKDIDYIHTAGAYENAGLCALAIPDKDKAAQYFIKALDQDPEREQSLYELVSLDLEKNQAEKAVAHFKAYPNALKDSEGLRRLADKAARLSGDNSVLALYQAQTDGLNNPIRRES